MKRKEVIVFICAVWILLCFFGVFVPKEYFSSLPDEISVESKPGKNVIIEFYDITRTKIYRDKGKYYLSFESLKYKTEPKIVELTEKEYRYCARVDAYRLTNQVKGGSYNNSICIKKGDNEDKYDYVTPTSPLYELQRIKAEKIDQKDLEDETDKKTLEFEKFLDKGKFEMAYLRYPGAVRNFYGYYYYKNAMCGDYYEKWNDIISEYKHEQSLNLYLIKKYEKGQIEFREIDLKADLKKKEELYERITGNTPIINRLGHGYGYEMLLDPDNRYISNESKKNILDNTTKFIDGYDHTAYEYIKYGKDGFCAFELYLPDENDTYTLVLKKPLFMPKWYMEWSVNKILLSDEVLISPGLLYEVVCFLILIMPVCLLAGLFRHGFKKTKSENPE